MQRKSSKRENNSSLAPNIPPKIRDLSYSLYQPFRSFPSYFLLIIHSNSEKKVSSIVYLPSPFVQSCSPYPIDSLVCAGPGEIPTIAILAFGFERFISNSFFKTTE